MSTFRTTTGRTADGIPISEPDRKAVPGDGVPAVTSNLGPSREPEHRPGGMITNDKPLSFERIVPAKPKGR